MTAPQALLRAEGEAIEDRWRRTSWRINTERSCHIRRLLQCVLEFGAHARDVVALWGDGEDGRVAASTVRQAHAGPAAFAEMAAEAIERVAAPR
jgi:hypothetical protein